MATIKVKSLLNSELEHIQQIALNNEAVTITDKQVDFDLSELPKIISGKDNGLSSRPWLFDLSDDIIDASLSYANGAILYVQFNDLDCMELEIEFSDDQIETLLSECIHEVFTSKYGGLEIEKIVGRDRDNAPETEMISVSVYDLIESGLISFNDCCVLYVAHEIKTILSKKEKSLPQLPAKSRAA